MRLSNGSARSIWVADFETTTDPTDCRVWAWGLANIDTPDDVEMSNDLKSFIARIADDNRIVYFHNLAFDGSFIIDFLLNKGFTWTDSRKMRKGQFTSLISSTGKFYSINVHWKNGKKTEFRDSLKKLPMKVALIAKAFGMPICKGELDYERIRPVGWEITDEEAEYIRNDVAIVARAIAVQIEEGMTKLTVGADSLAEYKTVISSRQFDRLFPVLPETMDTEIRRAYRGGFTYVAKRYQAKVLPAGDVYDVNSLYPSVMYDRVLPFGIPFYVDGKPEITEDFPLFIASITLTAKLKKDHIPCIQIKGTMSFAETEYLEVIDEPVTISCTNVDLALWEEHYDIDIISWNGAWRFHGTSGVFSEFIDKWMMVKENSTGGLRTIAKLHLNSLYGKFATNPNVTGKFPILEDGIVKLKTGKEEKRSPVYTAMGVFITAYARDVTIRAAQKHYDRFVYADTDSLHLLRETTQCPPTSACHRHRFACSNTTLSLDVHPSRLGAWKHEYRFEEGFFQRPKRYTERVGSRYVTHIAGLPEDAARVVRFHHYQTEASIPGKLLPKRVPGGIVLEHVTYTLKNTTKKEVSPP